ncbi:HlyD family type I secretion periplasmic adaptor subunit [Pseudooceanicola nanhaiensis]|uniref:HlyD family type I secretion periplasmic adaptor subunit n=1 Tax=Pseudooceanicola nanhaiensis TaxID=375761 RepID=UPI001CD44D79|nr:HlyD family type I secretion periplasmic adaptor subunit [Pseudooceanicola nanhaiensis]MCA0921240.1 HlyD family type I secretion periplasmic adaptor subunit [Pseudooceanicola nanhaiensis]
MSKGSKTFSGRTQIALGVIALLVLVGGFGTWSVKTHINGAIIASGQIEVERNRQAIQHPDGGVVESLLVYEGDAVEEGQVLLRFDASELRSQLAVTEARLYEYLARLGRSTAERDGADTIDFAPLLLEAAARDPEVAEVVDGQRRLLEARNDTVVSQVEQLEKRSAQISNQIDGVLAQRTALSRQLDLIEQELGNQRSLLDRGLAEASRVLSLEREQARLEGEVGSLTAQKAQSEGRITEIDLQIISLQTERREQAISDIRDLQYNVLELAENRRNLVTKLSRLEITAPVAGVIYGLGVHGERAVVRAADPVMYIVPQDRPLVIAARVEPRDIDAVHPAQDVYLRFSAFDQRRTPQLVGHVTQISADAFTDEASRTSFYRAEIVLSEGEQDRLPEGTVLIPGMPVEAYIRTDERTPLAYLIKPFSDYFVRAFRES